MPKVIDLPTVTSITSSDYLIAEASGGGTKKITLKNAIGSGLKLTDIDLASQSITWTARGSLWTAGISWSSLGLTRSDIYAVSVGATSATQALILPCIDTNLFLLAVSSSAAAPSFNAYHILVVHK